MSYQIDQSGVELIASFEGFVNGVYNDSRGFATCGYGHLLHTSHATEHDHQVYDAKGRAFFLKLLHDDIERVAMRPMREHIHVDLNQNRVNALASAAFNCGPAFLMGTVGRRVNAKDFHAAADAFELWAHPPELLARREHEARLFQTPPRKVALPWLKPDERRWCTEYDRLLHTHDDVGRRRVLRRVMAERAVDLAWAAKHEGGWERENRRQRHHSLAARSS